MNDVPDHTGTKDHKVGMWFRSGENEAVLVGSVSDRDQPYTFGQVKSYLSAVGQWEVSRLMRLRGWIQNRRLDRRVQQTDQDGLD